MTLETTGQRPLDARLLDILRRAIAVILGCVVALGGVVGCLIVVEWLSGGRGDIGANIVSFGLFAFGSASGLLWAFRGLFPDRRAVATEPHDGKIRKRSPRGLGGWMFFPALGTFLTPVYLMIANVGIFIGLLETDTSNIPPLEYYIMVVFVVLGLAALNAYLAASIYTLVLMVKYRRAFPGWFTGLTLVGVVIVGAVIILIATNVAEETEAGGMEKMILALSGSVFWVLYIQFSRRVRNTFVN